MSETPVFVKIEEYKEILSIMNVINKKLDDVRETLAKLKRLKHDEDEQIVAWSANLNDVSKKIEYINELLSE